MDSGSLLGIWSPATAACLFPVQRGWFGEGASVNQMQGLRVYSVLELTPMDKCVLGCVLCVVAAYSVRGGSDMQDTDLNEAGISQRCQVSIGCGEV